MLAARRLSPYPNVFGLWLLHALTIGGDLGHAMRVVEQLRDIGAEPVEGGGLFFNGVRIVGKGQNSVVIMCRVSGVLAACKVRRGDSTKRDVLREAAMLARANSVGVGPRLITFTRDVLVYEFVDGVPLAEWWRGAGREDRLRVAMELVRQALALDSVGVRHNQLVRGGDHVLVAGGRPVIIDFEAATEGRGNLGQVVALLAKLGVRVNRDAVKAYKAGMPVTPSDVVLDA